jgi:hypothetical protein
MRVLEAQRSGSGYVVDFNRKLPTKRASGAVATFTAAIYLVSADDKLTLARVSASRRVTKIAIDKRARESENREHEEMCAGVLPASGRLCGEKAAGCGDPDPASGAAPASHTESDAATHCRAHRTLCGNQAGKCQYGDLPVCPHDHRDRFKDGARYASLQENERRTMRLGLEGKSCVGQNPRPDPPTSCGTQLLVRAPRDFLARYARPSVRPELRPWYGLSSPRT